MQPQPRTRNPISSSKYLSKSRTVVTEIQSYQNKRHNFIGKQMEANDGNMPMLDMSDVSGHGRSNSNNRSAYS